MRGTVWFFTCLLIAGSFMSGCSDKSKTPAGIIPSEQMGSILWDMVQADQYADLYVLKDSAHIDKKAEILKLYDKVLRIHQVTRDQFSKSYQFYKERPDLTRPMFDSLMVKGNQLRNESYARVTAPPATPAPAATAPVNKIPPPGQGVPVVSPGHPMNPVKTVPGKASPTPANGGAPAKPTNPANGKGTMPPANGKILVPGSGNHNPITLPPGSPAKN